jgi:hypothetical protein
MKLLSGICASSRARRYPIAAGAAISIAAMFAAPAASAATLNVGPNGPFTTIQAAVNAAATGDTISVAPGRYVENVVIKGKGVTVVGEDRHLVVVDGNHQGPVFTVGEINVANSVILSNLTITRGLGNSQDAFAKTFFNGGGIVVVGGNFRLSHSIVTGNFSNADGGGVSVFVGGPTTFTTEFDDDAIVENHAYSAGGAVSLKAGDVGTVLFTSTEISRNVAGGGGGGLSVLAGAGGVSLNQVTLAQNSAGVGGAIYSPGNSGHNLNINVVNSAIVSNSVTGNDPFSGLGSGGGVFSLNGISLSFTVLAHNTAQVSGGAVFSNSITLDHSFVVENQAPKGGGIFLEGPLMTTQSVIIDNLPNNCDASAGNTCPQ